MIEISETGNEIAVAAPYSTVFVAEGRRLAGRWNVGKSRWMFPREQAPMVREALRRGGGELGCASSCDLSPAHRRPYIQG